MPHYLLEAPHSNEECVRALDDLAEKEPGLLEQSWFGCKAGEHTEWATVEATNEADARNMLPEFLREKAHVVEVSKFSPGEVRAMHQR